MREIKENSAFKTPRERLALLFKEEGLHYSTDLHLCFVCGAADRPPNEPPPFRRKFIDWVRSSEPKLICVRAENAVTDLLLQQDERGRVTSLSAIEEIIGETVHSLLIFPESAGSFAELGLFSANSAIREKTLVAIESKYQGSSFITLGPISVIAKASTITPQPLVISDDLSSSFEQIRDRLLGEAKSSRSYNKRISHQEWSKYDRRMKLFILEKIFCLTGIITEADLFDAIFMIFGKYEKSEVRLLTGLLSSMELIKRTEFADIVYVGPAGNGLFIGGKDQSALEIKASWLDCYRSNIPEAITEMAGARA
ncbi:retron St85 family effector protein [Stenotrophomonas sp. LARHCG68]